jgi:hypothetical protein
VLTIPTASVCVCFHLLSVDDNTVSNLFLQNGWALCFDCDIGMHAYG